MLPRNYRVPPALPLESSRDPTESRIPGLPGPFRGGPCGFSSDNFDLIVIGCGPAGEKALAQAAYFGKRVAVIEREG